MARARTTPQKWAPPAARIEGERILAAKAAQQRVADAALAVKSEAANVKEQAARSLEERIADLEGRISRLTDDLPKIIPAGGGGKRMVAKVLKRDFGVEGRFGSAAGTDASDYATAAQGAKADAAIQPDELAAVATSGQYADLSGIPTLGSAAGENSSAFATAAQGSTADSAAQPGDLAAVATSGDASDLLSGTLLDARVSATLPPDKAFRRGNITGAVSQTAGVPTGAIVERGSNANGSYVRFADGTQICWLKATQTFAIDVAAGAVWRANHLSWTYPAAFSVPPDNVHGGINANGVIGNAVIWGSNQYTATETAAQVSFFAGSSLGSAGRIVMLRAEGRWF